MLMLLERVFVVPGYYTIPVQHVHENVLLGTDHVRRTVLPLQALHTLPGARAGGRLGVR